MRLSSLFARYPGQLTALFVLTLGAPVACGGEPAGGDDDSNVSQGGSMVSSGGSTAGAGARPSGGSAGGPVIEIPPEGGACASGCVEDKVVCGNGALQVDGEECDDGNTAASDGCSDT